MDIIEKPLRYIGREVNSISKKNAKANMLLAFPDIYEIGMSHFGSRILYEIVNYKSPYALERAYMPWVDMYKKMKDEKNLLKSIESNKTFNEFNIIGFSLTHELSYTNVLAMMELGGLNVFKEKRDKIVIAGGGASFNPKPMSTFIDAFVIGEAEEVILKILNVVSQTKSKKEILSEISNFDGVYVDGKKKVKKVFIKDLNNSELIKNHLIPHLEPVHNRITYEVQRGCSRGCRFCQAGMIYRPVRQRDPKTIASSIENDLKTTGYSDLGFLSLSSCDYKPISGITDYISKNFKNIKVSLPSLRIESLDEEFLKILATIPKSGFTIAPEAGSERLRQVINKNITEDEILNTISLVTRLGWNNIKTYFMLGLPTETSEDIDATIDLAYKMEKSLKNYRNKITLSFSNFIPKPHTPFQWERQNSYEEFEDKIKYLFNNIKSKRMSLKWSDPKISEIEGLLSRGDEKTSWIIYNVYKKGEILSSWNTFFDYSNWLSSILEVYKNKEDFLCSIPVEKELPWDIIDTGISKAWLIKEKDKAYSKKPTGICNKECKSCGVCNNDIGVITYSNINFLEKVKNDEFCDPKFKIRAFFKKTGVFKLFGHFEIINLVNRAVKSLPVSFSKGFNPKPIVAFSPPIAENIESLEEVIDVSLYKDIDEKFFIEEMNKNMPEEMHFYKAFKIPLNSKSIQESILSVSWRALINEEFEKKINIKPNTFVKIQRKGTYKEIDLSLYVKEINISSKNIYFSTLVVDGKTIKPSEVLSFVGIEDYTLVKEGLNI